MSMIHRHKLQQAARKAAIVENVKQAQEKASETGKEAASPYTKTDINRMGKDDLVTLATEVGIENAESINGAELKKKLIEHFGL